MAETKLTITTVPDAETLPVESSHITNDLNQVQVQMDRLSVDTGHNKKSAPSSSTAAKLSPHETDGSELEKFDYDSIAENMVQFQAEYHFSDENLSMDNYLLSQLREHKDYWLPITIVAGLSGIKQITENIEIVKKALRKSKILQLNNDETKVRRPNFIPPKPKQHKDIRRTVFLYGLYPNHTADQVLKLTKDYGKVKSISFVDGQVYVYNKEVKSANVEKPDNEISIAIMTKKMGPKAIRSNSASFQNILATPSEQNEFLRSSQSNINTPNNYSPEFQQLFTCIPDSFKAPTSPVFVHPLPNPNGNPLDFSHLKSCFVVFESQSQCNNFIRSRSKSTDGIRATTQYEYVKFQKKLCLAKARGISPLISPNSIELALNSPSYAIMGAQRNSLNSNRNSQLNSVAGRQSNHHLHSPYDRNLHSSAYIPVMSPTLDPLPAQMQRTSSTADSRQLAMQYYLSNISDTPILIVPQKVADAVHQMFTEENTTNFIPNTNAGMQNSRPKTANPRANRNWSGDYTYKYRGNKTWSHSRHQQRYSADDYMYNNNNQYQHHNQQQRINNTNAGPSQSSGYFNFDERRHSNMNENGHRRYSDNRYNRYNRSMTTSSRDFNQPWRNYKRGDGRFPPSPSPNYFTKTNVKRSGANGGFGVVSNAPKYVMKKQRPNKHISPSFTPKVASFVVPHYN